MFFWLPQLGNSWFPKERKSVRHLTQHVSSSTCWKIDVDARSTPSRVNTEISEFIWSHANIAGKPLKNSLKTPQNVQEAELTGIVPKVFVTLPTQSSTKRSYLLRYRCSTCRITKSNPWWRKCSTSTFSLQEGQYGVKTIGQPAVVGAHGNVRPVNIPLNDAKLKMQAFAKELQVIIDEAWKTPPKQLLKLMKRRFSSMGTFSLHKNHNSTLHKQVLSTKQWSLIQ